MIQRKKTAHSIIQRDAAAAVCAENVVWKT